MLAQFALTFTALFVAMDIVGTLPMYLSMTRTLETGQRNRIVNTSMIVAFVVALIFIFVGKPLFQALGITISDFKIAGGLILLLVSLADLQGGPAAVHQTSGSTGIVPLAVPLITGPGVLTALILQVASAGLTITLLAVVANYLLAWIILKRSQTIMRLIGEDGIVVISKIAALLLAAIAIAMMRSGIFELVAQFRATG